jgi:hypothetical protein
MNALLEFLKNMALFVLTVLVGERIESVVQHG